MGRRMGVEIHDDFLAGFCFEANTAIVGGERQFAVFPVDQDSEFDRGGAAMVK